MTEDAPGAAALLDVLGCAVPARSAVYLSTPITNGPRYIAWRQTHGDVAVTTDIVTANLIAGRRHAEQLRQRFDIVITPTELHVPGWSQSQYRGFWSEVVVRYARLVVLGEGWQFSTGCVTEFIAARTSAVTAVDHRQREVDDAAATQLLEQAMPTLSALHLPTRAQTAALDAMGRRAEQTASADSAL